MSEIKARLLGLDYGDKTIGVAVSDPLGIMALGVETIRRDRENALKVSIRRIGELIKEYSPVKEIVLGFPKNMDNSQGERCAKTLDFKEKLSRNFKTVPVVLWDERLSTAGARRTLSGKVQEKTVIDEMAAVFILQGYMDYSKLKRYTERKLTTGLTGWSMCVSATGKRNIMSEFDEEFEGSVITMYDEDDNEINYRMLAVKKEDDGMYMLAEEVIEDEDDPEAMAEVLIFKCIEEEGSEEMVLELVDEEHESFDLAFELFKEDLDTLGVEY